MEEPERARAGRPPLDPVSGDTEATRTPRPLSVRLPVALDAAVRQLAHASGQSQADIVRRATANGIGPLADELTRKTLPAGAKPDAALFAITRDPVTGAVRHTRCGCHIGAIVPAVEGTRGVRRFTADGTFAACHPSYGTARAAILASHLRDCPVQ